MKGGVTIQQKSLKRKFAVKEFLGANYWERIMGNFFLQEDSENLEGKSWEM